MMRAGRWLSSLWLAGCLMATGCSKKEEPPPHPAADLPLPDDLPAQPTSPPEGTLPREGEAAAKPPVHVVTAGSTGRPVEAPPDEEQAPPQEPAGTGTAAPSTGSAGSGTGAPSTGSAGLAAEDVKNREWTSGVVDLKRQGMGQATLRSVRAGAHPDFDRVVFEFEGTQPPGYRVEYPSTPPVQCGSGDPASVAGKEQLQVTFTPARAHTDEGQATVATRELKPALPVLQELERTCDFEGEVTWVLGNKTRNAFRVMELREPTRLVVDVRH